MNVCCHMLCLKIGTNLACCNIDVHQLILITFDRNVAKEVSNQMVLYFPTSPY